MINVGVVGATGYTGYECVRLLQHHPKVKITWLFSQQQATESTHSLFGSHTSLPDTFTKFEPHKTYKNCDVLLLAVPHVQSHEYMSELAKKSYKIIDLSADFRLNDPNSFLDAYQTTHQHPDLLSKVPYGLPELYEDDIKNASIVANPGCYATATILSLYPLLKSDITCTSIIVDAKSGVSGAGKSLKTASHFGEANEHLSAYSINNHRHQTEIAEQLGQSITFVPHLIPMSRGIFITAYITLDRSIDLDTLASLYTIYRDKPFVTVSLNEQAPSTKQVVGSNQCYVNLLCQSSSNQIIITGMIDNLIKGAAGQAIQNMNCMFDMDQTLGLPQLSQII